jgi:Fe-S-cluster containining protein
MSGDGELAAGRFSAWLAEMRAALRDDRPADVPCGGCTACCRSSQFVHIAPDETDTLAHIPAGLLFPAPRLPQGHVLLGYDERGHCPMLTDGGCAIYEHRPRTCRTYDCRIFPATGLTVDDGDAAKADIARQARRWRFSFPADDDRRSSDAVRAAAASIEVAASRPAAGTGPATATQVAVRAIETYEEFL